MVTLAQKVCGSDIRQFIKVSYGPGGLWPK